MSGGAFDYKQYEIDRIIETIESEIKNNGRIKTKEELRDEELFFDAFFTVDLNNLHHRKYSDEVIEKFKKVIDILKKAQICANCVDYLISNDDDEQTFLKKLNKN